MPAWAPAHRTTNPARRTGRSPLRWCRRKPAQLSGALHHVPAQVLATAYRSGRSGPLIQQPVSTQQRSVACAWVGSANGTTAGAAWRGASESVTCEVPPCNPSRAWVPHPCGRRARIWRCSRSTWQAQLTWADTSALAPDDKPTYVRELEYLVLARVRIAQGRTEPASHWLRDALRLLDQLVQTVQAAARMDRVIEIQILRALALHAQGQRDRACDALEQALILAGPEGYVRVVVDEGTPMAMLLAAALEERSWGHGHDVRAYAEHLRAVLRTDGVAPRGSGQPATPQPGTTPGGELLTARELDVLQLLAQGRSNAAIAQELIVAVGTVKRHVNSIMGKLQVHSRLEAVARAHELGLL